MDNRSKRMEKARQRALDDFARLVREGHPHTQAMVDSLQVSADRRASRPKAADVPDHSTVLPDALAA